jgi:mannose-1-phosphate guanylyltransferase
MPEEDSCKLSALILAGGLGTRLRPVTYAIPKPLIPAAGAPILYHVLDLLPPQVGRATLAGGYKIDLIRDFLRRNPYRIPVEVVEEREPLGTGGAMRHAGGSATDPFFLLNGDVVAGLDLEEMLRFHMDRDAFGTMTLFEVDDPEPFGVARLDGQGRILEFVEKPPRATAPSRWINAGVSLWRREILEVIPDRPGLVSFEREAVPKVLGRGIYGFPFRTFWEDGGTPTGLLRAQRLLFDHPRTGRGRPRDHLAGATVIPPVAIGPGTRGEGATVGRYVTLGRDVELGPKSRVEDSILLDRVKVGPGATVRGCILGEAVEVPPGVTWEGRCEARPETIPQD